MSWKPLTLFPLCLVLLLPPSIRGADDSLTRADEQLLAQARVGADGPALLEFFRARTLTGARREKVLALIQQLGAQSYAARSKASAELIKMGPLAVSFLREAGKNPDLEVKRRVTDCLNSIRKTSDPALPQAAARLLAVRKPAGAAAVLLDYLPHADNTEVAEEVCAALGAVALRDGKAEPVLVQALADQLPVKRGAAAAALCRAGDLPQRPAVRKLLHDPVPAVRLQVALALAQAKDKSAFPVLIALLSELPADEAWQSHDFLYQVARETAPDVPLGSDAAGRRKCQEAWAAWWARHGERLDLSGLRAVERFRGLTLIVLLNVGSVLEQDVDGKIRWRIDNVRSPLDAQMLPGERVLIAENGSQRVTERNCKGEVLWEMKANNPIGAQRLPNGHTFIVTRGHLFEVDRQGKEVYHYSRPNTEFISARKFRDGRVAFISGGNCTVLDRNKKELITFAVTGAHTTSCLDVLPNGNLLVGHYGGAKVVEYSPEGKVVWQAAVAKPISVVRLPNGNTLIANHGAPQLIELNRQGQIVMQKDMSGHPTRARRR
jgi:hypothetical protein